MERLAIQPSGDGVVVVLRWRSRHVGWPALVFVCAGAIAVGAFASQPLTAGGALMIAARVLVAALALGAGYATLAALFNRSVVTLTGRQVSVAHGPFSVPSRSNLAPTEAERFELGFDRRERNNAATYYRFEVIAHLVDDRRVVLLSDRDHGLVQRVVQALSARLEGGSV